MVVEVVDVVEVEVVAVVEVVLVVSEVVAVVALSSVVDVSISAGSAVGVSVDEPSSAPHATSTTDTITVLRASLIAAMPLDHSNGGCGLWGGLAQHPQVKRRFRPSSMPSGWRKCAVLMENDLT